MILPKKKQGNFYPSAQNEFKLINDYMVQVDNPDQQQQNDDVPLFLDRAKYD